MGSTEIKRALAALGGVALTAALTTVPAHAGNDQAGRYYQEPTPYDFSDEFDPECEGLDLTVEVDVEGVDSQRYVKGSNKQAFFYKDRYRFFETWTDDTTSDVLFTWRGRYKTQEYAAKRVRKSNVPEQLVPSGGLEGPIYRFKVFEEGWDVVKDEAGSVLYRTEGTLEFRNLFDTLGDRQPGGESLRLRVVDVEGPHPLLDRDICEVAQEQIGQPN
jgi:hypothetical protein